jgi:hypothetical protein
VIGDAAIALLKAGAEAGKKDVDGYTPLDLAPAKDVRFFLSFPLSPFQNTAYCWVWYLMLIRKQVREYIVRKAEEEGIEL